MKIQMTGASCLNHRAISVLDACGFARLLCQLVSVNVPARATSGFDCLLLG